MFFYCCVPNYPCQICSLKQQQFSVGQESESSSSGCFFLEVIHKVTGLLAHPQAQQKEDQLLSAFACVFFFWRIQCHMSCGAEDLGSFLTAGHSP